VPTSDGLLYDDEWSEIEARHPERFRRTYAISREHAKAEGGKVYVQDRMAEHAEELFERLDQGAHIYFCGLKGMMPGILDTLQARGRGRGAPPFASHAHAHAMRVPGACRAHAMYTPCTYRCRRWPRPRG
jgi:NAD(P)H-flavin reductase